MREAGFYVHFKKKLADGAHVFLEHAGELDGAHVIDKILKPSCSVKEITELCV
jgi:hypothetical protein